MKLIVWFLCGSLILLGIAVMYYPSPGRQHAFDSVVSAKEGDLPEVHRIVDRAKPSFLPGDDEFFANYLKILDAGQFGTAEACRAEGMLRFHNDPRVMQALRLKPGSCAKRAAAL